VACLCVLAFDCTFDWVLGAVNSLRRTQTQIITLPNLHHFRLSLLLGRNWAKALQLVDQGAVHCFQGVGSGRRVFQVRTVD